MDDVKQSAFVELAADVVTIDAWVKSFFDKLFKNYVSLQKFMDTYVSLQKYVDTYVSLQKYVDTYVSLQKYMENNDTQIETVARTIDIWRQPTANFQSSQVSTEYTNVHIR